LSRACNSARSSYQSSSGLRICGYLTN